MAVKSEVATDLMPTNGVYFNNNDARPLKGCEWPTTNHPYIETSGACVEDNRSLGFIVAVCQ